jgi:hypothetical protein
LAAGLPFRGREIFMAGTIETDAAPPKQSGLPNRRDKLKIGSSFCAQMDAALERPKFGMIQMASVAMRSEGIKGANLHQKRARRNRIHYYKNYHTFQHLRLPDAHWDHGFLQNDGTLKPPNESPATPSAEP